MVDSDAPPTTTKRRGHTVGDTLCLCPGCVKIRQDIYIRERFGIALNVESRDVVLQHERLDRRAIAQLDYATANAVDVVEGVDSEDTFESLRVDMSGEVDLSPTPAILETVDGTPVLYAGKVTWLYGEPSSGKSWVSIMAANGSRLARRACAGNGL